ncbi:MAG: hypothetical protein WC927_03945 [Bacilli bacterium]|jgi:hypothetical protein
MDNKAKEQMLEELTEVQKMLEKKTEKQGKMIKKFQKLISNEGLFSQIIDFFPYPIIIYTLHYTVFLTNRAFVTEINEHFIKTEKGALQIQQYKITDIQLAASLTKVFEGKTFYLEGIKNPFSMFSGITKKSNTDVSHFNRVLIFPVPEKDDSITHGVLMFML